MKEPEVAKLVSEYHGLWSSVTHTSVPKEMSHGEVLKRIQNARTPEERTMQLNGLQMGVEGLRRAANRLESR